MGVGDDVEVGGLVRGERRVGGAARAAWAPVAATWRSMRAWWRAEAGRRAWLAQLCERSAATEQRG